MSIIKMKADLTEELLLQVEKPARYTGNEWNAVYKDISKNPDITRFAFCFPDTYEVGMSHIGLRILYDVINQREDACCERAFAPWTDMERAMRERGVPLFALESRDSLASFDFIGFTLQYELCYTNVLNMLDLAGLSPRAKERGGDFPVVIAGGPCVCNPAPMSGFIDLFVAGEGEEAVNEILDLYRAMKSGAGKSNGMTSGETASGDGCVNRVDKREFLREASKLEGVYAPAFPPQNGRKIKKRIIKDFNSVSFPERGIVPNIGIIHDRAVLELFRGCVRGCRFCQAGYIYRPVREKEPDKLISQAAALVCSTGYEEISLSSLSTGDYTELDALSGRLAAQMAGKRVNISLPSLRANTFSEDLADSAGSVRKGGLTFAPEAGTQRLRDVINKGVTDDDLLGSVETAFNAGWGGVKLYFMIGLPTETTEDLDGIADLVGKVVGLYKKAPKENRSKDLFINVSVASFIPKPFTPFQREAQDDTETLLRKQNYLKDALKMRYVKYNWHDARESLLEAVFARGGAETGEALYEAWKAGAKFDGWSECFNFEVWLDAFGKAGVNPSHIANRRIGQNEPLPWDIMDYGVSGEFLSRELERAYAGLTTDHCRAACADCGVAEAFGCGLRGY